MSDTEILDWILSKLDDGLVFYKRHKWFLNGEPCEINWMLSENRERFTPLKESGDLVLLETGYYLESDLGIEWGTVIGDGDSRRLAIIAAIENEKVKQ